MGDYVWELRVIGGGGGLWYFDVRPTKLQCEQRVAAAWGDRYTLRRVRAVAGQTVDPIR
jgi:hypothetical protein